MRQSDGDGTAPRRSLVLAGGGMRVAYQAGVIAALSEAGITFRHVDGTSGGIINLAMLLSGRTPEQMCDAWSTLDQKQFVSLPPLRDFLKGPNAPAWGDADGIRDYVFPHLGVDTGQIRSQSTMDGTINVCNFSRKTVETIPHDRIDEDYLVAGISLPMLMPAVRKNGEWYTDAVWIMDANVLEAARRGADEIWLVWCIGNTPEYHDGAFLQYVHMIEMAANGSLFGQLERVQEIPGRAKPVILHVIKPEFPLPLDPDYYLGHISGATLVDMGFADASRYLTTMRPEGVPLTPEVTRMRTPTSGVMFNETMKGRFALGVTDPREVAEMPEGEGGTLAIHVTVHIDDIDRFVEDPSHKGVLTGRVDFPPFITQHHASTGVFNLFCPSDDPRMTLMVYELGFRHEGRDYYLAGHKEVRDDPGIDVWKDTTTLFTTLHEGTDRTGPIVGAGVLRLGVNELASLVASMRPTNAPGLATKTSAIAKFGKLFLRELWTTYGASAERTTSA
jgi:predicted acylesterase/phospholipase RssA